MRESQHKRLTRSATDRLIAGVFGGLGKYFNLSAILLRLIYVVITALTGFVPGILIYIIMVVIMPADPAKPDLLSFLRSMGQKTQSPDQTHQRSRRTLTDVEERDIKKNGRS